MKLRCSQILLKTKQNKKILRHFIISISPYLLQIHIVPLLFLIWPSWDRKTISFRDFLTIALHALYSYGEFDRKGYSICLISQCICLTLTVWCTCHWGTKEPFVKSTYKIINWHTYTRVQIGCPVYEVKCLKVRWFRKNFLISSDSSKNKWKFVSVLWGKTNRIRSFIFRKNPRISKVVLKLSDL